MSKTLETKKRILRILKIRQMTISGLSRELGLTEATISQHLGELGRMGAIERIENEHFRKLKYYRARETLNPAIRYLAVIVVLLAAGSSVYLYVNGPSTQPAAVRTFNNSGAAPSLAKGGLAACPMLFYQINGSIESYSGFNLYYLNGTDGMIPDYVIASGSGTLQAKEFVSQVLDEPTGFNSTRQHGAFLRDVQSQNLAGPESGINVTVSPGAFSIMNNETVNVTVGISVGTVAPSGTYLLEIDGPCGGGVGPSLITIGSAPYNGTFASNLPAIP